MMRKVLLLSFLAVLSLGCAITDYPVIFDTRGADLGGVMSGQYDEAYIVPSGQVATIWSDGSDELYTLVVQDWKADQWLYTYNNFDASGALNFLAQTYCDPTRQDNCRIASAWNPDLPTLYPHGDQGAGYNNVDDPFDYVADFNCNGARSLSLLVSYTSRIGECGSGVWADKQGAALEFSNLERVNFRGKEYYHLPIDSSVASFSVRGQDGATSPMPIYGRFNGYIDEQLRLAIPVTPNAKYQLRWLGNWVNNHGSYLDMDLTYGALTANFKVNVTTVENALDRL
jgi:hypothetical protein